MHTNTNRKRAWVCTTAPPDQVPLTGSTIYNAPKPKIRLFLGRIAEVRLAACYPEDTIALISHNDPIRAAVVLYLGMPLDMVERLEISPASVTRLTVAQWGAVVHSVNLAD